MHFLYFDRISCLYCMVVKGVECVTLLKMNSSIGHKLKHKIENMLLGKNVIKTAFCRCSSK